MIWRRTGARRTKVYNVSFVYGLHVSFQLVAVFVTKLAVVRLLPSVNSHMHDKLGRVREILDTIDSGIWLVFQQMMLLMDSQ